MTFVNIRIALGQPRQQFIKGARLKIYALIDPQDDGIRYIGVTNKPLSTRLARHLKSPTNSAMRGWIGRLGTVEMRPQIVLLEVVRPTEWEDAERGWIFWCRERGALLNMDRGGMARDTNGKLRTFVAGKFREPIGKSSQVKPKMLGGEQTASDSRPQTRPRLVPVADGVFRRTG